MIDSLGLRDRGSVEQFLSLISIWEREEGNIDWRSALSIYHGLHGDQRF